MFLSRIGSNLQPLHSPPHSERFKRAWLLRLAAHFKSEVQQRWWSPTLSNLRSQKREEDRADLKHFFRVFFCEWHLVGMSQSPFKSVTFSMFCWVSFTLGVRRTLSGQMGNSRRVTRHPVYFGSLNLQQPGVWAKRNGAISEYRRAPGARASTCLFLAVPWCCVIGGAVTSQPLSPCVSLGKFWAFQWLSFPISKIQVTLVLSLQHWKQT